MIVFSDFFLDFLLLIFSDFVVWPFSNLNVTCDPYAFACLFCNFVTFVCDLLRGLKEGVR